MIIIVQNTMAFIGTFIFISTFTMLLIQGVVCLCTNDWSLKEETDYRIIIAGIIIACLLIPFYYLPA